MLVAAEPDPAPVRAPDAEPAIVENDKPSEPVVEPLRNVEQALAEVRAEEEVAALEAGKPNPPKGVGSKFAPARSLAPTPRPTRVAAAQTPAQKPEKSGEEVATRDISGDDVRPGTRMVQLGAYGSEAVAKRQWDLIINANSDLLGAKRRYIQRTQSNGKTFYRLRASSFETLEASRAACSALSARGVPCIPTIAN